MAKLRDWAVVGIYLLTLLVVGFVAALIVSIVREERGVADAERKDETE